MINRMLVGVALSVVDATGISKMISPIVPLVLFPCQVHYLGFRPNADRLDSAMPP
jgi:hypothetical protein